MAGTPVDSPKRVLSIQSHVVAGYVGNKCAIFPLQVLGFEVDSVNSVQFSNHTGYGTTTGQVLHDNELADLMNGLHANHLDRFTHLLTGYVGSASFLNQIAQVVQDLRKVNPELIYVCDPVLGDEGKFYVPPELVEIYKEKILPLADILIPNQFEAETLSGMSIKSVDDAWRAVDILHDKGAHTVVFSSTDLAGPNKILCIGSSRLGSKKTLVSISIPRIPETFTGTGDLFAAVFLAWMSKTNHDLITAIEKTVATLQAVILRTYKFSRESDRTDVGRKEMHLIQSKADIEDPQITLKATVL